MFLFDCPLSDFYCLLSMEIPPFYLSSRVCELYLSFLTFKAVWKQDFLWKLSLPKLMNFTIHGYASKRKREIPIIDGDEMPLHWNESETTSVKENYILSQERITVFTQVICQILFHCPNLCLKESVQKSNWITQKESKVNGHQKNHNAWHDCQFPK